MRSPLLSILCTAALSLALSACSIIVKEKETPCGNGQIEGLEECDTENFGGETCATLGFPGGGHLICTSYCRIDEFNCNDYVIGDGQCDDDESPEWSGDCQRIVQCGDDLCDPSELVDPSMGGCEADCAGIVCGDGWCERPAEYDMSCPEDCSSAMFCGDGICQSWEREAGNCSDCGVTVCGNGRCEAGEESSCPSDCGMVDCNVNYVCEPGLGENGENCPDCFNVPNCGNGTCEWDPENPENCPVDCGGGMCALMNGVCNPEAGEDSTNCSECAGVPQCGDWNCGPGEDLDNCPFDCSTNCMNDGKCQPESGEYAPHCQDCAEYPHCGNNVCDEGEGEDINNCGHDCSSSVYCGDNAVNQPFELCDGWDLGGQQCQGSLGRRGQGFEAGDLRCNGDCTYDTWGCYPLDIGAPCTSQSDCGGEADLLCLLTPGEDFCTATCDNPGDYCGVDPSTICEPLTNFIGITPGNYCLRPCMSATPGDCPPGFACDALNGMLTRDYCHPPLGGM